MAVWKVALGLHDDCAARAYWQRTVKSSKPIAPES
jgi:hypothetical protein